MQYGWQEIPVQVRGRTKTFHRLDHPGSVAILAMREGRFALVRQYRPAVEAWLWEIPAGTMEAGEEPAEAAARELEEETGWKGLLLEEVARFFLAPGYSSEHMHLFLARDLVPGTRHLDEGEVMDEPAWLTPETMASMADRGEIADAKTLAALLWLARHHQPPR